MTREEYTKNIEMLNYYTKKYDEGIPEISDEQWDNLYFECCEYEEETGYIDPKSPSATIQFDIQNNLKKVTHNHPMLSLDKTKDNNVLKKWLVKEPTIVMHKMDGLTCSVKYENGKLVSAETRGNGKVGEDITANAFRLPSIPKTIPTKETTVVDGEVICKYDDFEEFSNLYKNPRNFAAGSIRLQDPNECEKRRLTFIAWDMITGTDNLNVKLNTLKKYGFIVVDYEETDLLNLEEQQERMKKVAASKKYPIDGLVYKINDYYAYMAKGSNEHGFLGGLAFKFYDELFETKLTGITWSLGKSGIITPVATFEPVVIDGTTVKNASLHNLSIMKEILGETPYIGEKVYVFKANMIIPQIAKAEKKNTTNGIEIPKVCPICGHVISIEKKYNTEVMFCTNKNCPAKIEGKILQFVGSHGLDIESLSTATIRDLINLGWISEMSDIFSLKNHREEWINIKGYGENSVDKILEGIPTSIELWKVIASAGIPNIEKQTAILLADYFQTWENFIKAVNSNYDFTKLNGIGYVTANVIKSFDYSEIKKVMNYITIKQKVVGGKLDNMSFCITGKLSMKREDLVKIIEANGGKNASVTKDLTYLICNDKTSTSGKSKKAKELNIPIITEEEFMKMI